MAAWTGCIAGALTEQEFRTALRDAGCEEIEIRHAHRVHDHATSAIIRRPKANCLTDRSSASWQPQHDCRRHAGRQQRVAQWTRRARRLASVSLTWLCFEGAATESTLGIGLSVGTPCVCPWLGRAKLRLGEQLGFPATADLYFLGDGPWRTRTSNLGIKSPLLCQLS